MIQSFVLDSKDFNPTHTLECGQFFRYQKQEDGTYLVTSGSHRAKISKQEGDYRVDCDDAGFFKRFFDVSTDYGVFKRRLSRISYLKEPIKYGSGIRLLRQPLFETIISFIISQNNNIKRIQGIIERICQKCGTKQKDAFGEFFAFPTQSQLKILSEADYKTLGLGYRAKYLAQAVPLLTNSFCDQLQTSSTEIARKMLIALPGIGRKVADCILLFGLSRGNVFPVDVWVERVFFAYFEVESIQYPQIKKSREKMSEFFVQKFGSLSGLVQQYLFYSMRENS